MKSICIRVIGRVQGVGFRAGVAQEAYKLGLNGFVRNEPNGSVYIEIEGDPEVLDNFLQWCHQGPRFAKVDQVIVEECAVKNFSDFEIHRF